MSATALVQRPGISRGEIDSLLESAVAGLVPMFDARANLWCSRMVRTEGSMVLTGLSRRYTMMTLLGLHRTVKSGRPIPFDIDSVVDTLVHEPNWPENLGDLGTFINTNRQQARSERVESAQMTHSFGAEDFFDTMHYLSRGGTFRFIDQQ